MAKSSRALTRYSPPPVVVRLQQPSRLARARPKRLRRRAARGVSRGPKRRRAGRNGNGGASTNTASLVTLAAGGAGVGYLLAKGHLDFLPVLAGSRMLTLGIAGVAAMKFSKNKYVKAAGLAAMVAAAVDLGRTKGGGGLSGDDSPVEGSSEDSGSGDPRRGDVSGNGDVEGDDMQGEDDANY